MEVRQMAESCTRLVVKLILLQKSSRISAQFLAGGTGSLTVKFLNFRDLPYIGVLRRCQKSAVFSGWTFLGPV